MYNANVTICIKKIPAKTEQEAKKWLKELFNELAGSNDGSEFLTNLLSGRFYPVDVDIHEENEPR